MTQKELLYFDDAVSHEQNLCAFIEYAISNLKDTKLVEFMKKELKNHEMIENKFVGLLEDYSNEWWRNNYKLFIATKK